MANMVMPEALWMLSLAHMLRRCVATVCMDINRESAISLLERPLAIAVTMSFSRAVSSMSPLLSSFGESGSGRPFSSRACSRLSTDGMKRLTYTLKCMVMSRSQVMMSKST